MNIVLLLIYLVIGVVCHMIFIGSEFNWSDAWTWIWLIGWPVMILSFVVVAVILVTCILMIYETVFN